MRLDNKFSLEDTVFEVVTRWERHIEKFNYDFKEIIKDIRPNSYLIGINEICSWLRDCIDIYNFIRCKFKPVLYFSPLGDLSNWSQIYYTLKAGNISIPDEIPYRVIKELEEIMRKLAEFSRNLDMTIYPINIEYEDICTAIQDVINNPFVVDNIVDIIEHNGRYTDLIDDINKFIDSICNLKKQRDTEKTRVKGNLKRSSMNAPDDYDDRYSGTVLNLKRSVYSKVTDYLLENSSAKQEQDKEQPILPPCIPIERRGLQKIAGCDNVDRAVDIVFIHGLGGDSWTTWMKDKDDIATFWPTWVVEDFSQVGLWTLGYAASGSKWKEESMPLADRGNQVLELLHSDGLGERPLVFITHSMGGIVAKQILRHAESFGVSRWETILKQTQGIAFIATPHSGAHIANFAELARAVYRTNEHVEELAAHDPRLRELHGWFLHFQRRQNLICRSYCEKREVRPEISLLGIKLPRGVLVVDETSAEPNIPGERAIPLDEDHISICKPSSRSDDLYKSIRSFLNECLRAIVVAARQCPVAPSEGPFE
jgi:hypothetical protein